MRTPMDLPRRQRGRSWPALVLMFLFVLVLGLGIDLILALLLQWVVLEAFGKEWSFWLSFAIIVLFSAMTAGFRTKS